MSEPLCTAGEGTPLFNLFYTFKQPILSSLTRPALEGIGKTRNVTSYYHALGRGTRRVMLNLITML